MHHLFTKKKKPHLLNSNSNQLQTRQWHSRGTNPPSCEPTGRELWNKVTSEFRPCTVEHLVLNWWKETDKWKLNPHVEYHMTSQHYCGKTAVLYLLLACLSSTRQDIWMGRQSVWYGSFFSTLEDGTTDEVCWRAKWWGTNGELRQYSMHFIPSLKQQQNSHSCVSR